VDTERPSSAAFLAKFPIDSWPTLLLVDPRTERPLLRWLGSVTDTQLVQLLDDGERAFRPAGADPLQAAVADADRLQGSGRSADAAKAFAELLRKAPPDWRDRTRIEESLVLALEDAGEWQACAETARTSRLPSGHSRSDVLGTGLLCALEAPKAAPWRGAALDAARATATAELADDAQLADDRSGLYELLVMDAQQAGRAGEVKRLAREWLAFLERDARAAPDASARAALDPHRLEAALDASQPALALPALLQSERESPDDFEPPALLAIAYRELGRYPEALAASERAFSRAQGPRRLRILWDRSEIYAKLGDAAARARTLRAALDLAATLPPAQRPAREVNRLREALGATQAR